MSDNNQNVQTARAPEGGYERQFRRAAKKPPPDISEMTPKQAGEALLDACRDGAKDPGRIERLVAQGGCIDEPRSDAVSAATWLVSAHQNELAALLIGHLAASTLEQGGGDGMTLLHWAALVGNTTAAALLIEKGVGFDGQSNKGRTAEREAVAMGHPEVAKLVQDAVQQRALEAERQKQLAFERAVEEATILQGQIHVSKALKMKFSLAP